MALIEYNLFGEKRDKVATAIQRMKSFEPPEGYFLAFSGGKDSVVLLRIAQMAGVKFDAHYSVTTVDPPEAMRFVRDKHPEIAWERPEKPMHRLIVEAKTPPTRNRRYCCTKLKEIHGVGRVVATGVRWAESINRKANQGAVTIFGGGGVQQKAEAQGAIYRQTDRGGLVLNLDNDENRRTVEQCYRTNKTLVNPIIDWEDEDVWEFIRAENIPYCGLYDDGIKRVGCVGCPLGGYDNQKRDFARWPGYYKQYLHAFDEMVKVRQTRDMENRFAWNCADDVMRWWLGDKRKGINFDQLGLDDIEEAEL